MSVSHEIKSFVLKTVFEALEHFDGGDTGGGGGMEQHGSEWHNGNVFVTQTAVNASISSHASDPDAHGAFEPANVNIQSHISAASPHSGHVVANASISGATKTKITYDTKGLVTSGADATTADIADSANKRYCTDAEKTVIGNTSGTNSGDQDLSGYPAKVSPSVADNFVAFSDTAGTQKDSGSKASDFATAGHTHESGAAGDSIKKTYTQADHTFTAGQPLYVDSFGVWQLADASVDTTAESLGIVESVAGDDFVFVHLGAITGSWIQALTKGATYFLSESAGGFEDVAPLAPAIDKPILTVIDNTEGSELALVRDLRGVVDSEEPTLGLANVQLVRTDTNTITLTGMPGTDKVIEVNGESVDLSSDKTLDTDSASHFIITGTTTVSKSTALNSYTGNGSDGNAYNAHGLFHVYACNSKACFNFASYDRRGSIILNPNAPTTDGYLAASGDGANARHVGWVICGSSRTMEITLSLLSRYNRSAGTYKQFGGGSYDALTPGAGWEDLPGSGCQFHAIFPANVKVEPSAHGEAWNDDVDQADIGFGIWLGPTGGDLGPTFFENIKLGEGYRRACPLEPWRDDVQTTVSVHFVKLRSYIGTSAGSSPYLYTSACWVQISYGGSV